MRKSLVLVVILLILIMAGQGKADVKSNLESGFLVRSEATVGGTPDSAYNALVGDIGRWWDPSHTFSGDSRNLSLDARAGGCFYEALPGNGSVRHLEVVFVSPGKVLRMIGALGPLQDHGLAGSMTWSLQEAGDSTKVVLTYSVGGYFPGGLQEIAPVVDQVLFSQLLRLKSYVETRVPESP